MMWTDGPAMAIAVAFPTPVPPPVIQITFSVCMRDCSLDAHNFDWVPKIGKGRFVRLAARGATMLEAPKARPSASRHLYRRQSDASHRSDHACENRPPKSRGRQGHNFEKRPWREALPVLPASCRRAALGF